MVSFCKKSSTFFLFFESDLRRIYDFLYPNKYDIVYTQMLKYGEHFNSLLRKIVRMKKMAKKKERRDKDRF